MSRQQSVLRNTVGYMLTNIDNQTTDGEEKSKPEVIKLGLDLHARQVTECRQLDGSTPKPAQQWDPWKLLVKVEEWVKAGIKVYSCYEAGPCGYWYHRELTKRGAVNYVVAPQLLENQRTKRQKTDRLDARSLLGNLESYLRGNRDAMSIIAVPSPLQEQQRSVVRYREQLMRNRRRSAGSSASPDPGDPCPCWLVAAGGLEAVQIPAAGVDELPVGKLARGGASAKRQRTEDTPRA
jgi:hypothetical protein